MKIARLEHLHADAGKGALDFLKLTTDDGAVGWSEYNETFGGVGVTAAIDGLAPLVVGKDPRAREAIVTTLYAVRRQAPGPPARARTRSRTRLRAGSRSGRRGRRGRRPCRY